MAIPTSSTYRINYNMVENMIQKMTYEEAEIILEKWGNDNLQIPAMDDIIYRAKLTVGLHQSEMKDEEK